MKGHATIELTNVKTGEVRVIEEDNIVTNFLQDVNQTFLPELTDGFRFARDLTLSGYDSEVPNHDRTPFTEFGGLLMFREQLEDSPEKYYPRGGITMTAHASDKAYAGFDLTRGSFNENLSSYNTEEGKVTLVWDFNMEQGNGTIGTVCLCNHVDGQIGYGSKYIAEDTNLGKAPFYHHSSPRVTNYMTFNFNIEVDAETTTQANSGADDYRGFLPVYLDIANNRLVFMCNTIINNNIVLAVADMNITSVAPVCTFSRDTSNTIYFNEKIKYFHIPIAVTEKIYNNVTRLDKYYATPMCCYMMWSGLDFQGNFWYSTASLFPYTSYLSDTTARDYMHIWTAGAVMKFTKLDFRTLETTEYNITNTTGSDIVINTSYDTAWNGHLRSLCVVNGYLVIRGNDQRLYAINLENNSDVHAIAYEDGSPVLVYMYSNECNGRAYSMSHAYRRGWLIDVIGDRMFINCDGGVSYDDTALADGEMLMVDMTTFTCKPLSAVRNPKAQPAPSVTSTSSPNSRNSGTYDVICVSDTPLRLLFRMLCKSGNSTYGEARFSSTWTATDKRYTGTSQIYYYTYTPLSLITINTLAEPVTKTADMTMRITYTLTA